MTGAFPIQNASWYQTLRATPPTVWLTKDGRQIPIRDMSASHLLNTIRFLRRRALPNMFGLLYSMGEYIENAPDGAAMACEAEADAIARMTDDEFLNAAIPQWKELLKEAERRKIL